MTVRRAVFSEQMKVIVNRMLRSAVCGCPMLGDAVSE